MWALKMSFNVNQTSIQSTLNSVLSQLWIESHLTSPTYIHLDSWFVSSISFLAYQMLVLAVQLNSYIFLKKSLFFLHFNLIWFFFLLLYDSLLWLEFYPSFFLSKYWHLIKLNLKLIFEGLKFMSKLIVSIFLKFQIIKWFKCQY